MTNIHAQALGKLGGKQSVKSRFKGKSKTEISEIMKKVRWTKRDTKKSRKVADDMVDSLNSSK